MRASPLVLAVVLSGCMGAGAIEGTSGRAEPAAELAPKTLDECLQAIRTCTTEALADASADAAAVFRGCVQSSVGYDEEAEGDVSCANACASEPGEEICGVLERAFTETAEKGAACIGAFDDCMSYCRSEADNMTDGFVWDAEAATDLPEATCLYTGLERTNCSMYASATSACGGRLGDDEEDHESCMQMCDAAVSPWTEEDDDEAVFRSNQSAPACEYCLGQCEGVPDVSVAWQTIAQIADQSVRRGRNRTWTVTIPAETTRFRVVLTPATSEDDPELSVWAPGVTQRAACTSENGPGDLDTCVVEPLPGQTAVTPGAWRVIVKGAANGGQADNRHHYGVALQVPAPSPSDVCIEASRKAIEGLEAVNETTLDAIGPFVLVGGHSDRELIQVQAKRGGEDVQYVVNAETLGGDPCLVYAVARMEEASGLRDDGETLSEPPSEVCQNAARAAVTAVEGVNGHEVTMGTPQLAGAHSDREIVRVPITRGEETDSWLVTAETLGGDPCLVYGLQLFSQQIDLGTANP